MSTNDPERTVVVPVELLDAALDYMCELRGERSWWKDEPRCGYDQAYYELCKEIKQVEAILNQNPVRQ
jgi:hypothetical protein